MDVLEANLKANRMSFEDRRELVLLVFGNGAKTPDGRRMGVYVELAEGEQPRTNKRWTYEIKGHLVDLSGFAPPPKPLAEMVSGEGYEPRASDWLFSEDPKVTELKKNKWPGGTNEGERPGDDVVSECAGHTRHTPQSGRRRRPPPGGPRR